MKFVLSLRRVPELLGRTRLRTTGETEPEYYKRGPVVRDPGDRWVDQGLVHFEKVKTPET